MPGLHAVYHGVTPSSNRMDTAAFNAKLTTSGRILPPLPSLDICDMISSSSFRWYDPHLNTYVMKDDWALQSVIFYAHAERETHTDSVNKPGRRRNRWTMHILECSLSTKQTRTVLMEPTFNPQGQLYGFTMCLATAANATSPMTWAVQQFKTDAIQYIPPNGELPRSFYHEEFIGYLNDRGWQEYYNQCVLPADRTGFFIKIVVMLIQLRVIDGSVDRSLARMIEGAVWANESVPHPPVLPTVASPSMISKHAKRFR